MRGVFERRCDRGGTFGEGRCLFVPGGESKVNKKIEYKIGCGLRWLLSRKSYTTTNQKQVAMTEGSMKGRRNEREVRGKHNTIVLGGIRVN